MSRDPECGHCAAVLFEEEIKEGSGYCQNCLPVFKELSRLRNYERLVRGYTKAMDDMNELFDTAEFEQKAEEYQHQIDLWHHELTAAGREEGQR